MRVLHIFKTAFIIAVMMFAGFSPKAQTPSYSCVAMNDTLISSTVYQFDVIYIKQGQQLFTSTIINYHSRLRIRLEY